MNFSLFTILFVTSTLCFSQKQFTLEEIWSYQFYPKYLQEIQPLNDGEHYTTYNYNRTTQESSIISYHFSDPNEKKILLSSKELSLAYYESYSFSPNETKILLGTELQQRYRYSKTGVYYVYNRNTKQLTQVFDEAIISPKFSPDGTKIAFIFNNNLYYKNLVSFETIQVTFDGAENQIINGLSDWVYEEEFEIVAAYDWNSDSSQLAYFKFNESEVPSYEMKIYSNTIYPKKETFKYPKAGETNSIVTTHIYNTNDKTTKSIDLSEYKPYYLPRLQWTNTTDQLSIQILNRQQNEFTIVNVNTSNSKTSTLYKETNNTYIEITNHLTFLKDNSFIISSEKSGFRHLYHYDENGILKTSITKGNWEVTDFYGIDPSEMFAYFQSTENSEIERHLYKTSLNGKNRIALSSKNGIHEAHFNATYSKFIHTFSSTTTPPRFSINSSKNGNEIRILKDNTTLKNKLSEYLVNKKEFSTIAINGTALNSWIIKPTDFDSSKKYPVLLYQYAGPGSQTVKNTWNNFNDYWHQLLANKGYIIACIDGRGTGFKGAKFKKQTQFQLGKLEAEDQIAFAKYLQQLPYIDKTRIGIWGWSYGGFNALNSILKSNNIFKAAIAVAPVTHWSFYDTIYTERFLTTPQENKAGYNKNSPLLYANNLKSNLLLVHGTADDNVHIQNTLQMAKALTLANKQFDLALYTDKNHSIYGGNTRLHLYTKMTNFILNNL